jgi:GWxTD domain-containing protein
MKNKFTTVAIIFLICICSGVANAQKDYVTINSKDVSIIFRVETSSPDERTQTLGSVFFTGSDTDESRFHRVLVDREGGLYLGYDLVIKPANEANKFNVSIKPLSKSPPKDMRLNDLTIRSLPKYPEEMIVEYGDTISLDLLYNPQTNTRINDLIKFTPRIKEVEKNGNTTTARSSSSDYSADLERKNQVKNSPRDANKLRLTSARILINESSTKSLESAWKGYVEGYTVYVYIPGKGRFVFSLFPHSNYSSQKIATVNDNKINFEINGDNYEVISEEPIISGGGGWNVWVLHDPNFKPELSIKNADPNSIHFGAAGNIETFFSMKTQKPTYSDSDSVQMELKARYQKWLDEDVRYIITDEEKEAFSRLDSISEREEFVESFWRRRDTNPETIDNEFRQDYYKRIAYANQYFAFGETVGWRTDRGRIYITYGKPDQIQKTASGELWIYNYLPDLGSNNSFEFVRIGEKDHFRLKQ